MVVIGQRLASGSVAANIPTSISSPEQAAVFWGAGSIIHRMAMAAFKQYPYLVLTGCAVDDAEASIAATATFTFAGQATGAGFITAIFGADTVTITIASGATPANTATAFAAEINKYINLPFTATANAAVVTLTFKNKGTCGNYLGKYDAVTSKYMPEISISAPGLTCTVTGWTGGQSDPSDIQMTNVYAALASKRYHLYAIPFASLAAAQKLDAHLESISDEINQKYARGYMFICGALAEATTISAVNARRLVLGYIRKCRRPNYENAAALAAMQASEERPWKALNNTELVGCDTPDIQDRFSFTEINNLLWSGVTPFEVGAGEKVRCVRMISTYTTNEAGSPDSVFLDSFKVATADYVREAIVNSHKQNFSNAILRDNHEDGEPDDIITPADVRSNNIAVCKRIEKLGGLNSVDSYKDQFTAVRDPNSPGRVNSKVPIDIVDAAHVFATDIQIVSSF
jgi:phage tail sheath gpL-like